MAGQRPKAISRLYLAPYPRPSEAWRDRIAWGRRGWRSRLRAVSHWAGAERPLVAFPGDLGLGWAGSAAGEIGGTVIPIRK